MLCQTSFISVNFLGIYTEFEICLYGKRILLAKSYYLLSKDIDRKRMQLTFSGKQNFTGSILKKRHAFFEDTALSHVSHTCTAFKCDTAIKLQGVKVCKNLQRRT